MFESIRAKVITADQLPELRLRNKDKKIIFCSGCYDILQSGHAVYFNQCKQFGDILVVGVGRDEIISQLKGPGRPVNPENNRLYLVAAMQDVDYAVLNDSHLSAGKIDFRDIIQKLGPDLFIVNDDDTGIEEKSKLCESIGTKIEFVQRDQLVDELGVAHPGRRPHPRVHRVRREPRHRVDLVDEHVAGLGEEEVDPRQPLAAGHVERLRRHRPDPLGDARRHVGRGLEPHVARGEVLGLEVVELVVLHHDALAELAGAGRGRCRGPRAPRTRSRGRTTAASTTTFGSCSRAASMAASSAAGSDTLVMPMLDPARAGLTNTGHDRACTASIAAALSRRHSLSVITV